MKRLTAFFVLFLTALCFALTASAAGDAIHSVTIDGNAVKVSVTAQTDCHLFVALYDENGQLFDVQSADLFADAKQRTTTLVFPESGPAIACAKAFLLDRNTHKPLCSPVSERVVYAMIYDDGTMVFQYGYSLEPEREIYRIYHVDMEGYTWDEDVWSPSTPWSDNASEIKRIEFADLIQPKSTAYWFYGLSNLEEINNLSNLDTANVTDMRYMFSECWELTTLDVSHFDTSNVADMTYMFGGCRALKTLDVSHFDTSNVFSMGWMFRDCWALTALDVSHFDTSNVTNMMDMFDACSELATLDVSHFNTSNVMYMEFMFSGCGATALDVSRFDTANVTDMSAMFQGCDRLTTLDVSGFNTANVTDMSFMFNGCSLLTTLDVSGFNTENVTDMSCMFSCEGLTTLNVSNFDTSNVTEMDSMFSYSSGLMTLDLNNFNTANVTDMSEMFLECSSLTAIYVSNQFITNQVENGNDVFKDCVSLIGGAGTRYNESHTDYTYAHIDGGPDNPGYFTAK